MIFYMLRSIPSEFLIPYYFAELKVDTLEVIIKWLQVSVSECNRQIPQTKNPICVQGLGSERPRELYDRFQGELLYKAL